MRPSLPKSGGTFAWHKKLSEITALIRSELVTQPLSAIVLGGCLLRRPLNSLPDIAQKIDRRHFRDIGTVHSFGEMFQVLDVLMGHKDVPAELRPLTGVGAKMCALSDPSLVRDLDIALIEPGSPVDIRFRDVVVNRSRIQTLLRPVESMSKDTFKLCQKWMRVGLVGMNDDVRESLAKEIEDILPNDNFSAIRRAVLYEARAEKSDVECGFRKMRDLLGCPLGAVIYVFRYMPDGRPVIWPAGAREEVIAAATPLKIPVFEPVALVQEFGVSRALEKDGRHYSSDFLPIIGDAIVRFAHQVHAQGAAAA